MAPPHKRKRGDRSFSQDSNDGSGRPSPHRPQNLNLAQQNQYQNSRGGGLRRPSRGGRGGHGSPRSPVTSNGAQPSSTRDHVVTSTAMSPPTQNPSLSRASTTNSATRPTSPAEQRTSQPSIPQNPSKPTPTTYSYEHVTDERIASWRASGRRALVDNAIKIQADGDAVGLINVFQELVRAGVDGRLDAADAGAVIRDIISASTATAGLDPISLFLDYISLLTKAEAANPTLRTIVTSTNIPPSRMRQEIDEDILLALNLVRSTFSRMAVRNATNVLYRQSAYNLLREETEGYSKLMTEYFTTTNNDPPSGEVVAETFQKVKALIGAFDLDVGRVLDVTLDVFANLLVKHYRFFIKFLRGSSWWPESKSTDSVKREEQSLESLPRWALPESSAWNTSEEDKQELARLREHRDIEFWDRVREVGMDAFFELGGRRLLDDEAQKAAEDEADEADEDKSWVVSTRTLPPPGNRTAAQLLGFKLRFYASSIRDATDLLPDNLIYLAALLIKIGFISLRDLYPHLYPDDEAMSEVRERLMKEKEERERKNRPGGGTMNALAMAGALADDTLPPPPRLRELDANRGTPSRSDPAADKTATPGKSEDEEIEKLPEPADQKIHLLKSLLCIGAIPEALFILGLFPWLMDVHPELPAYIHRILHHSLSKVYDAIRPLSDREGLSAAKQPIVDQAGLPKGHIRLGDATPRKILRWAQLDRNDAGEGVDYRFYWDDWADNVPVAQSVDDVFLLCSTLLNLSGVKIGQDPNLLMKLARIGRKSLADDPSESNFARWIDLSKRILVPALSLTKANPGVVNEMFDLLKNFSISTRYSIYAEWYTGQISRLPDIKAAFDQAKAETRDVLKRISKTNTKPMARALAKVACASPGIVYSVALGQIESYDNLIEVVVECGRYFTYLGYDVLTWSLMNSLGGKGRERMQADGMLTSSWLRALSLFTGRVLKRYSVVNPSPILQYVTYQLRNGNSTDLEVLEQIISAMAGIRSDMMLNEAQTQAMGGGEVLQAQTLEQLYDKRQDGQVKNSSKRLMKALTEPGLAGQLLIFIAQERQRYVFHESSANAPLKVLGNNLDKIHQVFVQYLDMLRFNLSVKDFDAAVPNVVSLVSEFGIEPSIAFTIARASIAHAMAEVNAALKQERQGNRRSSSTEHLLTNGDTVMTDDSTKKDESTGIVNGVVADSVDKGDSAKPESNADNVEMKDVPQTTENNSPLASTPAPVVMTESEEPWHPVLKPLIDQFRSVLAGDFEAKLSIPFYVSFWQLSLNDLLVPTGSYEEEIKRLRDKIAAINADRTDITALGVKRKEQKKKEINEIQDRLRAEMKSQITAYSQVRARLNKEKDHWFAAFPRGKHETLNRAIIQECFLPRILLSPVDSLYTYKLLLFLHSSGTPGFYTMHLLDDLLKEKQMTAIMFHCTAREADNLGRFLNELLRELRRWHADQAVYERMAFGPKRDLPGFVRRFAADNSPNTFLEFEDFRRLLFKWHRNLSSAFKACFTSGEYMHIRNAIIMLKDMHFHFPIVNFMGNQLLSCVTDLSKSETREDLKLAATSLIGDLKRREKEWILPQAFHINDSAQNLQKGTSRSGSARPSTPLPNTTANAPKALNAAAAEFKPPSLSNGDTKTPTAKEVEDGEIEDAKKGSAPGEGSIPAASTTIAPKPQTDQPPTTDAESIEQKPSTPAPAQTPVATLTAQEDTVQPPAQIPEARPPTPATTTPSTQPNTTTRPDIGRSSSTHSLPARAPHALPPRPEPAPRSRMHERPIDRSHDHPAHRADSRGQPGQEYGRLDRPGDMARNSFGERREPSLGRRSRARTPERAPPMDRDRREPGPYGGRDARNYPDERTMRPPPRDARLTNRPSEWGNSPRERGGPEPPNMPSPADSRNRVNGNPSPLPSAPPTSAPSQHPDRNTMINPERAALIQQPTDRPPISAPQHDRPPQASDRPPINPERAALINGDLDRRSDYGRPERDGRGRSSRPHSPRRGDDRPPAPFPPRSDSARDERYDDRGSTDQRPPPPHYPQESRDRRDNHSANPPTGPRGDRPGRTELPEAGPNDRSRELFQPSAPSRPPVDPNHGRLSQDFSVPPRPQDPGYGRLNSNTDIPSGPRGRGTGGRGGRNFSSTQGPNNPRGSEPNTHANIPPSPGHERPPPGAPFGDRRDHREGAPIDQSRPAPQSVPQTPATEQPPSDMAGVHPSRLNQLKPAMLQTNVPPPPPPPPQYPPSATSHFPPSGPRGAPRPYTGGSGNSPADYTARNPPTGPSSATERRGPEDKRFAGIQNVLQQGTSNASFDRNDRGASIRGRANRPPSGPGLPSPTTSQLPTPDLNRPDNLPQRPDYPAARPDLPPPRLGPGAGPGAELSAHDDRSDSRRRREGGERRSGRHRSRSRSPHSRDRRGDERERDARGPRMGEEERDKRGAGGGGGNGSDRDRDSRPRREEGRERDRRDGGRGRDEGPPRSDGGPRGHEMPRRGEMPVEESSWGGPNGDGRMRGPGERRDERYRRDGRDVGPGGGAGGGGGGGGRDGRKRGHGGDDAMGGDSKRPRRVQ